MKKEIFTVPNLLTLMRLIFILPHSMQKRSKKKSAPKKADFFLYLGVYQGINLCFLPKFDFISE